VNHIVEYWDRIERGEIVASRRVIQQYRKFMTWLDKPPVFRIPQMDGTVQEREFIFSPAHANRPIEFIERYCRPSKTQTPGDALRLELFQKAKFEAIFGFVDAETGLRLCNETQTYEARKNGKSTESSGIGLFMQIADGEGGPEVVCLATKKDQARLVFDEARNMVKASPELRKIIRRRQSDLYSDFNFGVFKPLASDSNTLDGLNPNCGIIDELHAMKDRNLYDVVKQAMYARRQPLLAILTTAGLIREGIYDDLYEETCSILDGIEGFSNPRLFAFVYELDAADEWADYRSWQKANPGLGTIKSFATLAENVEKAKRDPSFMPTLLCKDFNLRQTNAGTWLSYDDVNNPERFKVEDLRGSYATGGVDLSSTTDLTCATLLVPKADGKLYVLQQYFIPEDRLEYKVREDKVPYDIWIKRGLVTPCEGPKVNYSDVTAWFAKMRERYEIFPLWVGYDSWGSQYWQEEMKANGFTLEEVRQGAQTMSQPMKEMAADLRVKRIVYDDNPVLKWCMTNTQIKQDENGNIRPVKGRTSRMRIDGTVALIDAYVTYLRHRDELRNLL
jgi:phage terminase large subunit-like protein